MFLEQTGNCLLSYGYYKVLIITYDICNYKTRVNQRSTMIKF